jgi:hypothetical protein
MTEQQRTCVRDNGSHSWRSVNSYLKECALCGMLVTTRKKPIVGVALKRYNPILPPSLPPAPPPKPKRVRKPSRPNAAPKPDPEASFSQLGQSHIDGEIRVRDAAKKYNVAPHNISGWTKAGYIRRTRAWYVDEKSLAAFLIEIGYHIGEDGKPKWVQRKYARGFARPRSAGKNHHFLA